MCVLCIFDASTQWLWWCCLFSLFATHRIGLSYLRGSSTWRGPVRRAYQLAYNCCMHRVISCIPSVIQLCKVTWREVTRVRFGKKAKNCIRAVCCIFKIAAIYERKFSHPFHHVYRDSCVEVIHVISITTKSDEITR